MWGSVPVEAAEFHVKVADLEDHDVSLLDLLLQQLVLIQAFGLELRVRVEGLQFRGEGRRSIGESGEKRGGDIC